MACVDGTHNLEICLGRVMLHLNHSAFRSSIKVKNEMLCCSLRVTKTVIVQERRHL
jgi:hypothetical protein